MSFRFQTLALLVSLLTITACSTGKRALQEGNYEEAVLQAVSRLREDPENRKAAETLRDAYPLALSTGMEEIDRMLGSQDPYRYAGVTTRYETLNKLADEINHCPAAMKIIRQPRFFNEQLNASRQKAAPEAYEAAMVLLNKGSREAAREAYYQFQNADRFVPGFKDAARKSSEAHLAATLKVVVEQIPVPGRYKISSGFFYDQAFAFMNQGLKKEFLRFYDPAEAKNLPWVDEILIMEFDDFVVGNTHEKESEKEVTSKDSVKVGSATVAGKTVDVFNKVTAKYTTHRREVVSTGVLAVQILDAKTNKVKAVQKLPGTFTWAVEWATYKGDVRALTPQQLDLCKKKPVLPPPPQDLFIEFTRPILDQLKNFLRNYYRNV